MSKSILRGQGELFLRVVDLIEEGQEVTPPTGMVFSTQPRRCLAEDGHIYFVKGPDPNVVVPEAVSYILAQQVELPVPEFALGRREAEYGLFFASREVQGGFRSVDSWLGLGRTQNPQVIQRLHVFDVLIANRDRNIGNLLVQNIRSPQGPPFRLVAIDFEKSEAFRGNYPYTTVPTIEPRRLRPSGILCEILQRERVAVEHFAAIERIGQGNVLDAFGRLEAMIGHPIEWKDGSAQLIASRARDIRRIVAEVWR